MKNAVIYARYSSDSQSEQSIEGQMRVCQEYAQRNDMLILGTYIDRAMTGTNDNRPDFQRMLKDSKKKQWEYVLVYKLDRFSRDKYEATIHKHTLKENGIKLVSCMENIPDTPEGIILESLLEGMNQYYSAELRQKVNRGLKESWIKDNATGGMPYYGYNIVDKKYVIDEFEAEIVKEIFTKYANTYTANAIAKDLKERGIRRKNGQYITSKYVYFIIHNIRYTGKVFHHGVEYDNIFPRIISDKLWQQVFEITESNKIGPSRKKEIYDYILSGKLICGYCKHRMSGISGTGRNDIIHYYYTCTTRHKKLTDCKKKTIKKHELEDLVINTTTAFLRSEETINLIATKIFKLHEKETKENLVLNSLLRRKDIAVNASNNIIKAIEQGIITEQTKTRLKELETEINQLEFDIEQEKQRVYTFLTIDKIKNYLKSMVYSNTEDIKVRKVIVNTFIREILLYDDRVVITYNFMESNEQRQLTKEYVEKLEQQVELAPQSALKTTNGLYRLLARAPLQT